MRPLSLLIPIPLLAGLSCAPAVTPAAEPPARWAASLEARPQFPEVSAELTAVRTVGGTTVQIELTGAEPRSTHPWHVHRGTCEIGGGIVGDPAGYPSLRVGDDGRALETAVIDAELQPGQNFHVNVHRAPDDLGTIIACGNLQEAPPR
jgi:hypothetical protein